MPAKADGINPATPRNHDSKRIEEWPLQSSDAHLSTVDKPEPVENS